MSLLTLLYLISGIVVLLLLVRLIIEIEAERDQ